MKALLFLGAALFCSLAAAAGEPEWVADAEGCKVANPQPQPFETIAWSGRCKDGFADGAGTVSWFSQGRSNGVTSGTFREGRLTGRGFVTLPHALYAMVPGSPSEVEVPGGWTSGSRLDGEFLANRLVGAGVLTQTDGRKFVVQQVGDKLVRKGPLAPEFSRDQRSGPGRTAW